MNVSRSEFSKRAFVLSEEDLRALSETVGVLGAPKYKLDCSDALSREPQALDDVLRFDNSPERSIVRLTLTACTSDLKSWASISFGNEEFINLRIQLEGSEEAIVPLNRELESRLAAMRPWYAIMTRGDVFLLSMAFLFGLVFLLAAVVAFGPDRIASSPTPDLRREARSVALGLGTPAVWFGLAWLLHRARNWLFPIGSFVLGSGKARYDVREKIRWTVVVGFVVSVAGSFVAALRW